MSVTDRNDALVDVFNARTVIAGTPTFNNGIIANMAPIIEELKGLRLKNRLGATFGSYGWSGGGAKVLHERLAEAKFRMIGEPLEVQWQPDAEALQRCREFGREIAAATKAG